MPQLSARFFANTPMHANPMFRLASSYAMLHQDSGAVISYLPKNACTTILVSLAKANGFVSSAEDWRWVHLNASEMRASYRELVHATETFVVLRCPFRRLVSVFLDKIVIRRQEFWTLDAAVGGTLDPMEFTFREFVEKMALIQLRGRDPHWREQSDMLIYDQYDNYLSVENMAQVAAVLRDKLGMELVDTRHVVGHGLERFEKRSDALCADMPIHDLGSMKRNGQVPDYQSFYDEALIGIVRKAYAADLRIYAETQGTDGLLFAPQ